MKIYGFRLEGDSRFILSNDELQRKITNSNIYFRRYVIKADHEIIIRLFGENFDQNFVIGFSLVSPIKIDDCVIENKFEATIVSNNSAISTIKLSPSQKPYYLCLSTITDDESAKNVAEFIYAGSDIWFQIKSEAPLFPLWFHLTLLVILLIMSGLFSGLNLGLMALDKNELKVIERCGTEDEKYYAKTISPVRKRGNYLLCTLLLGNVLVNSTLTILLDDLTSGIFAVIGSTLSIVIFGEIIPQAICSRHGLAVGAKTAYVTYLFMIITFPLSYPISKLLDKILGEEIGAVYDRERLIEYIRITKDYNNLEADEMNIISGAFKFKKISVADVMTPITDVFMLPYDAILNFDTLTSINNSGYSRIPVYENRIDNVVGLLHVKDLSLIDPDHNLPLKVVLDFYSHPLIAVYEDLKLDKMLNEFKQGKSHMALIRRVVDDGVNDPYFELLGVVTLEDIIEELIQAEINDETDVISDNRRKQKRQDVQSRSNYLDFIRTGFRQKSSSDFELNCGNNVLISPQLALAAFPVGPFGSDRISEEVLKVLMAKSIYFEAKGESRLPDINEMCDENVLYKRGQASDYFVMILEGRARVIVTNENQEYDAGPFCCFGIGVLTNSSRSGIDQQFEHTETENLSRKSSTQNVSKPSIAVENTLFVPDYTLICLEKVIYMKVTRDLYQMALKATNIERKRSSDMQKINIPSANTEIEHVISKPNLGKNLRNLPPKYRKISMSTNLPDSSLFQDFIDDEVQTKFPRSSIVSKLNPNIKRKLSPTDLFVKRADTIELLNQNNSPKSYGSIESLNLEESNQSTDFNNITVPESKEKITINGSLPILEDINDKNLKTNLNDDPSQFNTSSPSIS
ncbi:CBS and DUF21 domain containinf protein [Sarcoptes scabiei]|uniref:CBS and DUF21 domain containinf protein n=1 Tax=Sarcoptes scabiei TaxID=52283 RepID=A0A132AIF5_SARSC|nr:CBS and DUF21 domain containinf protein [Sarcoptes scabiei]